MPRYGNFLYNTKQYGIAPRLEYSVDPFTSTAIDYGVVKLTWTLPQGDFFGARIVRNQDGFSETVEDGVVVWEELHIDGATTVSSYLDGEDNVGMYTAPIGEGTFAYYTYWILDPSNVWKNIGKTYCLMPKSHGTKTPQNLELISTQDKFMGMLPRVFTTSDENPLGQVDENSDLYNFLKAFTFTIDEFLTYIDFLKPDIDSKNMGPSVLTAKLQQSGLVREANFSSKYQKRLLKNANLIYSTKGTKTGLKVFSESLTGYPVTFTDSPNLMLSMQDSTFLNGVGNWIASKDAELSAIQTIIPSTAESLSIENQCVGKVVVSTANSKLQNGLQKPITTGVPVQESTDYAFSGYFQKSTGTGNVTLKVYWYDFTGTLISSQAGTATSVGTSWTKITAPVSSPAGAVYAALEINFAATGTYYLDMLQFSLFSVTNYSEARGITVFLNPSKVNYITNPSFESFSGSPVEFDNWDVNYPTTTTVSAVSAFSAGEYVGPVGIPIQGGDWMMGLTCNSSTGSVGFATTVYDLDPDTTYTFSLYVKSSASTPKTINLTQFLYETPLSEAPVLLNRFDSDTILLPNTWTRVYVTATFPKMDEDSAASSFLVVNCPQLTTGDTLIFEGAQLEKGFFPTDYFDGNLANGEAGWFGTENASASYQYVGISEKSDRLNTEIGKYLPQNSSYVITTNAGVLYKNLT